MVRKRQALEPVKAGMDRVCLLTKETEMFRTLQVSTALAATLFVAANAQDMPAPAPILPTPEAGAEAPVAPMAEAIEEPWAPIPIETFMAEELDGADIRTVIDDERVATVDETLVGTDGSVEGVVAQFGGFLGIGREQVMLPVEEIDVFKAPDGRVLVRTSLTRDTLEAMPDYEG